MRDDARIDAGTGDHAGMRVPIGFGRVEVARRRHPRRQLEDVGKRTDCIDIYAVVGFRHVYDQSWRRLLQGGLDSRERRLVRRLSADQGRHEPQAHGHHVNRTPTR